MRRRLLPSPMVIVLIALTGCTSSWTVARSEAGRSGYNPIESTIGTNNVSNVFALHFASIVRPGEPVVGNGMAYVGDAPSFNVSPDVQAYDVTTYSGCTFSRCRPLFSAPGNNPALYRDTLFTQDYGSGIVAFDAHGENRCGGRPRVCRELWRAVPPDFGELSGSFLDFVVSGDLLIAQVEEVGHGITSSYVFAYDAKGIQNCTNGVCQALWFEPSVEIFGIRRLAFAAGRAITVEDGINHVLRAIDHGGDVWHANGNFDGDPVVADGLVWEKRTTGEIDAFDLAGVQGCSGPQPPLCSPRWSAITPSTPTGYGVAAGILYVGASNGRLYAFDATGSQGCTGAPKHCTPLWSALVATNSPVREPTIANGVVYAVSTNGTVMAFDAAGNINCSGAPKTCTPLMDDRVDTAPAGPAVVAAGRLLVPTSDTLHIYAEAN